MDPKVGPYERAAVIKRLEQIAAELNRPMQIAGQSVALIRERTSLDRKLAGAFPRGGRYGTTKL